MTNFTLPPSHKRSTALRAQGWWDKYWNRVSAATEEKIQCPFCESATSCKRQFIEKNGEEDEIVIICDSCGIYIHEEDMEEPEDDQNSGS